MEVGTSGNLGLSREYHKKLYGPILPTSIIMPNLKQTPKWVSEATNIVLVKFDKAKRAISIPYVYASL